MCKEGGLVRSSAVKVEERDHACLESLNWDGADDCSSPFWGRGERGLDWKGIGQKMFEYRKLPGNLDR
jgi:hypothetical protein